MSPSASPRVASSVKRGVDVAVSLFFLAFLSPLLVLVAFLVALTSKGGAIFLHTRYGKDGRQFQCIKFRTMYADSTLPPCMLASTEWIEHRKLRNDPRVTPIGRWLRSTSIDEVPNLINVLKGDMSLCGPRAITCEERDAYGGAFHSYTKVRPGVTGLWAVKGRSALLFCERVRLDEQYVAEWNLLLDLEILVRTPWVVLKGDGAY
jgi:exopolysaccharide production protein ExoY